MKASYDMFDPDKKELLLEEEESKKEHKLGDRVGKYGIWLGERGIYDERNTLNDLTGKEWLQLSKSFWSSERCAEDKAAFDHPAPFLIRDIEKLISLFTKRGDIVLDPFVGSGTTLLAAAKQHRHAIVIELNKEYVDKIIRVRIKPYMSGVQFQQGTLFPSEDKSTTEFIPLRPLDKKLEAELKKFWKKISASRTHCLFQLEGNLNHAVLLGDSKVRLDDIPQVDYCVTSPPYHNILRHDGKGVRSDNSQTRQGVEYYSDQKVDLGNTKDYASYLKAFSQVMARVYAKLKKGKYCSIIISDFTVETAEKNVHGDVIEWMAQLGFTFMGTLILSQDSKTLYPFGYPFQYRINHVHQYILQFLKS
jgi:DNA modification methylase